jgi:RNA polymerase sigma-70 factor, ECF subfamily
MDQIDPLLAGLAPPSSAAAGDQDLDRLLLRAAAADQQAFDLIYRRLAPPAYGVIRRVLRDPARSEEVTQEVMLEVWRTAARFDPARGRAATWVLTVAHRRAVDRVRADAAASAREQKTAWAEPGPADEVADVVEAGLDRQRVRHCLDGLTEVQRQSITLAYYGGYTYRQVADLVDATLAAIKSRIRDGLLRMRDCLSVT